MDDSASAAVYVVVVANQLNLTSKLLDDLDSVGAICSWVVRRGWPEIQMKCHDQKGCINCNMAHDGSFLHGINAASLALRNCFFQRELLSEKFFKSL